MSYSLDNDPHHIIDAMKQKGYYLDGKHIVYEDDEFHGPRYLDVGDYLTRPGVANTVGKLLSDGIPEGSIIMAPDKPTSQYLAKLVSEFSKSVIVLIENVNGVPTIEKKDLDKITGGGVIIGINDINNNGKSLSEIEAALSRHNLSPDEFRVMVDRNPERSAGITAVQFMALASIQMVQWAESEVPESLKKIPISTSHGTGRKWAGKNLPEKALQERLRKEKRGFIFDDGKKMVQMKGDAWFLGDRMVIDENTISQKK